MCYFMSVLDHPKGQCICRWVCSTVRLSRGWRSSSAHGCLQWGNTGLGSQPASEECRCSCSVAGVTDGGLTSLKQTGSKGILPGNVSEMREEAFYLISVPFKLLKPVDNSNFKNLSMNLNNSIHLGLPLCWPCHITCSLVSTLICISVPILILQCLEWHCDSSWPS